MSHDGELVGLRTIADYQFGAGAGVALFPDEDGVQIKRTSTGRPQQLHARDAPDSADADVDGGPDPKQRLVSFGTDGRFTLGLEGGRRLQAALPRPAYRVIVDDESEPFVRDGKNVFARFVRGVDPAVRPGDEVLVEHERGDLLAVGRASLAAAAIEDFETGMAVRVRSSLESADGA